MLDIQRKWFAEANVKNWLALASASKGGLRWEAERIIVDAYVPLQYIYRRFLTIPASNYGKATQGTIEKSYIVSQRNPVETKLSEEIPAVARDMSC